MLAEAAGVGRAGGLKRVFKLLSTGWTAPKPADGPGTVISRETFLAGRVRPVLGDWEGHRRNRLTLPPAPPGVGLGPNPGGLALGDEVAVGFEFPQDAAHLDHFLETAQQRFLGFAFMYGYF
jgi:hypothetical protein